MKIDAIEVLLVNSVPNSQKKRITSRANPFCAGITYFKIFPIHFDNPDSLRNIYFNIFI